MLVFFLLLYHKTDLTFGLLSISDKMMCSLLNVHNKDGVAQWVAHLTSNVEVVGLIPIKGPRCFLEQETLPLLLSTGWFQERIRA